MYASIASGFAAYVGKMIATLESPPCQSFLDVTTQIVVELIPGLTLVCYGHWDFRNDLLDVHWGATER